MNGVAKVFNVITIIFIAIMIFWFFMIDYSDLSFKQNRSPYLGIGSIALMIFAIQMIKRSISKNTKKQD